MCTRNTHTLYNLQNIIIGIDYIPHKQKKQTVITLYPNKHDALNNYTCLILGSWKKELKLNSNLTYNLIKYFSSFS